MDEDVGYKLIHSVDPTKIRVQIKNRFAKLTLSSNKKKEEQEKEKLDENGKYRYEKRESASRNLMEEINRSGDRQCGHINPIMRSDSPSDGGDNETPSQILPINRSDDGDVQDPKELEYSIMEPLEISDNGSENIDDIEQQVVALSEQVSSMTMNSKENVITLSSEAREISQIVSTESLRRSSSVRKSAQFISDEPRGELITNNYAICVVSSSNSKNENEPEENKDDIDSMGSVITVSDSSLEELRLDGEDIGEDSSSAIIISDSSLEGDQPDDHSSYDLITSDIPQTGETADAFLPTTLSNEKADRLEAFLRDVSQERKESVRYSGKARDEDMDLTPTHDEEKLNAKRLASADTESMSPRTSDGHRDGEEEQEKNRTVVQQKQFVTALDDTTPLSQSHSSIFTMASQPLQTTFKDKLVSFDGENAGRMALDETEANTLISGENVSSNSSLHDSTSKQYVSKMDSLVISETSIESLEEEAEDNRESSPIRSNEVVCSKQTEIGASAASPDSSGRPPESQISQIQFGVGSINISAKINIQIHISQSAGSEESRVDELLREEDDKTSNRSPIKSLPSTEENTQVEECCGQKQQKPNVVFQTPTSHMRPSCNANDEICEEGDGNLMTYAEKILTEIYGKSWRTPEVMRTLNRSGVKSNESQKITPTAVARVRGSGNLEKATADEPGNKKSHSRTEKPERKPPSSRKAVAEESVLDDFSTFRQNIEKTNLDSTRLDAVRTPKNNIRTFARGAKTAPRRMGQPPMAVKGDGHHGGFKIPQTEFKKRQTSTMTKSSTRRGRPVVNTNQRWRHLIDSESEEENASDDSDADATKNESEESSWSKDSESNDTDYSLDEIETARTRKSKKKTKKNAKDEIVYLDLSRDRVEVKRGPTSLELANKDKVFNKRLEEILRTCRREEKPKLPATPQKITTKRKLFTPVYCYEDDGKPENASEHIPGTPKANWKAAIDDSEILRDLENVNLVDRPLDLIDKHLQSIRTGEPIFKLTPTPGNKDTPVKGTPKIKTISKPSIPSFTGGKTDPHLLNELCTTPNNKYSFLKSLDVCASKMLCHPDALYYRDNYNSKKEDLARILYDLYNQKLFKNELNVPLVWNKKLINTAGRCLNKKKGGVRSCVVELSEKVLTSGDRLRCTLVHELCHAATWIFNGEGGHGRTWKEWAQRANYVFPELPKIGVCHQYEIEYKYTYKCVLCGAKSHAHSKSKKVENIRCSYCHGAIEIFLNKKDKDGNINPTPVREPTGFAKFVKDKYKQYKRPELTHGDVMKILSNEFAALKVNGN